MGSSCPKKEFKKEIEYVFRDSNEEKEKMNIILFKIIFKNSKKKEKIQKIMN